MVTLWRHRREHPVPRSPLVRPVLDAVALALVWVALVLPQRPDEVSAAVLVGIPVELLVFLALSLVLPRPGAASSRRSAGSCWPSSWS